MPATHPLLEKIRSDPKIPAPSQTVFRILELTRDATCGTKEVAAAVQRDSGLVAQLLREANSALYGFDSPTSSIAEACMRLGTKRVRSAVINRHVVDGLGRARPPGFDARRYWQSAFAASVAARDLARQLQPAASEDAGTAGLLCDIGIGLLAFGAPREYEAVLASLSGSSLAPIYGIERRVLGITHAEVGAAVLADWKLEAHLIEAVRHHHAAAEAASPGGCAPFARIVAAAVTVAEIALDGSDMDRVTALFDQVESLTDEADALVSLLLDNLIEHIQQAAETLSVELGPVEGMRAHFDEVIGALPDVGGRLSYRPMSREELGE